MTRVIFKKGVTAVLNLSVMGMGSMGSYMKTMQLQQKWQLKKDEIQSRNPQVSASMYNQVQQEKKRYDLQALDYKLQAGQQLSGEELDYLRQNNPEMYQKAMQAKAERAAYERELKNCKTQDEVRRLRMQRTGALVTAGREAANRNDLAACKEIDMRANGLTAEHMKFVKSADYAKLPKDWADEEKDKTRESGEEDKQVPDKTELPAEAPPEEAPGRPKDTQPAQPQQPEEPAPEADVPAEAPAPAQAAAPKGTDAPKAVAPEAPSTPAPAPQPAAARPGGFSARA